MKRYLSAFLLSAALLVPVAALKADDDHHHYRRYYDRDGRDYHVYNREEDRAYRSYLREQRAVRLSQAPLDAPLEVVCISEVVEDESQLLRYVGEKGLRPGRRFRIAERSPDQGALELQIDGGRTAAVSGELASLIWVRAA